MDESQHKSARLSVITPCYNSSRTLRRTYQSLCAQKRQNFEWIVLDDGSTDGGETVDLIRSLEAEAPFPVKTHFFEQNHAGSKSVVTACKLASGEYACILDHDDQLLPDATEKVARYIREYGENPAIAGIAGRCIDLEGNLIGEPFKREVQISDEGEIRFRQRVTAELLQFTKLDLLGWAFSDKKPGQVNGYAWAKLSKKYKFLYVNDVFRVYDTINPKSVTNNRAYFFANPEVKCETLVYLLDTYSTYLHYNPYYSIRLAAVAVFYRLIASSSTESMKPQSRLVRVLLAISYPVGLAKYLVERARGSGQ